MTIRRWLLGWMLLALAACADPGTGPGAAPDPGTGPTAGPDTSPAPGSPEGNPQNEGIPDGQLTLNPMSAVVEVGSSVLFRTMYRGDPGTGVAWRVIDTTVAKIGADGLVTGLASGETTIAATSPDGYGAGTVTVVRGDAFVVVDGLNWRFMLSGEGLAPLYDVWGRSGTDVFAVGSNLLWECCGTIVHFDGTAWSYMPIPDDVFELFGVWGSSKGDVFAVGSGGVVLRYDGERWSRMVTPTGHELEAIWGSSPTDVFAVGRYGIILHYDGSDWSFMRGPSPSTMDWLTDIWGTSSTDVFAVGEGILHYDGSEWRKMLAPSGDKLHGVWGTASDNVYAVGAGGVILHYDGMDWSATNAPARDGDLLGIWGNSAEDVFAVGDRLWWGPGGCCSDLLHYDGTGWTVESGMTGQALFDVWTTPEQVFIVGSGPTIIRGIR